MRSFLLVLLSLKFCFFTDVIIVYFLYPLLKFEVLIQLAFKVFKKLSKSHYS